MRRDGAAATWSWSPGAFELHGFQVGDVVPTTALLLSHIHPGDRQSWEALLCGRAADREPVYARLRRADGCERLVVAVGSHDHDAVEVAIADVTSLVAAEGARRADAQVSAFAAQIATIEQAKGVVMAGLGVSCEAAGGLLQEAASRAGTPVPELAEQLLTQVEARGSLDEALVGELRPALEEA